MLSRSQIKFYVTPLSHTKLRKLRMLISLDLQKADEKYLISYNFQKRMTTDLFHNLVSIGIHGGMVIANCGKYSAWSMKCVPVEKSLLYKDVDFLNSLKAGENVYVYTNSPTFRKKLTPLA